MDAQLFITREKSRIRGEIFRCNEVISGNYSPTCKVVAMDKKRKLETINEYLMDALNNYDFYSNIWR